MGSTAQALQVPVATSDARITQIHHGK